MKRKRNVVLTGLLALACLAGLPACKRPAPPAPTATFYLNPEALEGAAAMAEVRSFVALGPKDAGTAGAAKAAAYLAERLKNLEVETQIDEFVDDTPQGPLTFRNVIGQLPGMGDGLIIIGSHYDTKTGIAGGFEGANDSGSSTGLLLELARVLAAQPQLPISIWFAFFDGEECQQRYGPNDGLHGSRRMVRNLRQEGRIPQVRAMILLDMIGDRDLTVTIPRNSHSKLVTLAFASAREENARAKFMLYPFEIGDDHEPFLQAGIPAIDLIDYQYGATPGQNDYWHTPADQLDKLAPESLQIVGRVVLRMLNSLVHSDPTL